MLKIGSLYAISNRFMPIWQNSYIASQLFSVTESIGFSAVARLYNISPATLSKQIAQIEKVLGVRLFNRHTRFLEITKEGKQFVDHIRHALAILNEADTTIKQSDKLNGV